MFINPIKDSYITSVFGWRTHPVTGKKNSFHQGVDLARQPNSNVDVLASADGEVIRVGILGTYGNVIMIRHTIGGKRMETNYAHLKDKSMLVKVGQRVKQGQKIATMGSTGSSTAPHLHFEIHDGSWSSGQPDATDPAKYIKVYTKEEINKMNERIKELETLVKFLSDKIDKLVTPKVEYQKNKKPNVWAEEAVRHAIANGISDGTYLDRPATREELLVINYRSEIKKKG